MAFGGKQFHCQMSCDHELANEGARCSGKNASYITNIYTLWFKFILGLMFFELVSILIAIVPDYGNEYMTKEI